MLWQVSWLEEEPDIFPFQESPSSSGEPYSCGSGPASHWQKPARLNTSAIFPQISRRDVSSLLA